MGLANWRLTCFYETFARGSRLGILLNFGANNLSKYQAGMYWTLF
jgi:hypothetical protein